MGAVWARCWCGYGKIASHPYTTVSLLCSPTRAWGCTVCSRSFWQPGMREALGSTHRCTISDVFVMSKVMLVEDRCLNEGAAGAAAGVPHRVHSSGAKRCAVTSIWLFFLNHLTDEPKSPPPLCPHTVCVYILAVEVCVLCFCAPHPPLNHHRSIPPTRRCRGAAAASRTLAGGPRPGPALLCQNARLKFPTVTQQPETTNS